MEPLPAITLAKPRGAPSINRSALVTGGLSDTAPLGRLQKFASLGHGSHLRESLRAILESNFTHWPQRRCDTGKSLTQKICILLLSTVPAYFNKAKAKILIQSVHSIQISTRGKGLYEFTSTISEWVSGQKMQTGLLTVFCRHTSASLLIQENADPTVRHDIKAYFDLLAPENGPYHHNSEGPDDMPAHLKTALTQVQLSIPVMNGNLVLGTWQGVYLFEHRVHPHRREIVLHLIGE